VTHYENLTTKGAFHRQSCRNDE